MSGTRSIQKLANVSRSVCFLVVGFKTFGESRTFPNRSMSLTPQSLAKPFTSRWNMKMKRRRMSLVHKCKANPNEERQSAAANI